MENSYRIIWEIDIDAESPVEAAKQAYQSIINGTAPVFEVHQWREPEMVNIDPVAMIDVRDFDADLPKPDRRVIHEGYMGPDII